MWFSIPNPAKHTYLIVLHSQSYLDCSASSAHFHGELDIKTLGGAGFASQRTTGEDRTWDLTGYDGIELKIGKADCMAIVAFPRSTQLSGCAAKRYTFILKDDILPKDPDTGREQSAISYEYDFSPSSSGARSSDSTIFIPWSSLKATYRGREKEDAPKLELDSVKRFSIMMRR